MARSGFRVEVFWEEFGTLKEGSMEDCRQLEVNRKPTKYDMAKIEAGLRKVLVDVGLITLEEKKS